MGVWKHGTPGEPYFPSDYTILKRDILQVTDFNKNNNKYYAIELHYAKEQKPVIQSKPKEYYRLFSHYGRSDDLESNPEAGRKETRYCHSLEHAKGLYFGLMKDKQSAKKGFKKVSLFASNIGSSKAKGQATADIKSSSAAPLTITASSALPEPVQELIKYIYEEATATLNASSVAAKITSRGIETPLGILSLDQISKGEAIIQDINKALRVWKHQSISIDLSSCNASLNLLNLYYNLGWSESIRFRGFIISILYSNTPQDWTIQGILFFLLLLHMYL